MTCKLDETIINHNQLNVIIMIISIGDLLVLYVEIIILYIGSIM